MKIWATISLRKHCAALAWSRT